jgi:hypothetical protein
MNILSANKTIMIVRMMTACKLLPILDRALTIAFERAAAEELRRMVPALLCANHLDGRLGCIAAVLWCVTVEPSQLVKDEMLTAGNKVSSAALAAAYAVS